MLRYFYCDLKKNQTYPELPTQTLQPNSFVYYWVVYQVISINPQLLIAYLRI